MYVETYLRHRQMLEEQVSGLKWYGILAEYSCQIEQFRSFRLDR